MGTSGARPATIRSKITNSGGLLDGVDGRSGPARRYRDLIEQLASDLGGIDHISEAQTQLIRRTAGLAVRLEQAEAELINGGEIDSETYTREINALVRVLGAIGLKRRARQIPTLKQYIEAAVDDPPRTVGVARRRDGSI